METRRTRKRARGFLLQTEAGLAACQELWRLAKASGRTPWEALHDPNLPFNVTVMRGAEMAGDMVYGLTTEAAASGDELGMRRAIATLNLIRRAL